MDTIYISYMLWPEHASMFFPINYMPQVVVLGNSVVNRLGVSGLFFQRLWGSHLQPKAAPMLSFEGKSLVFVQFLSFFLISYLMRAAPTLSFGLKMSLSFCLKCKDRGFFRT